MIVGARLATSADLAVVAEMAEAALGELRPLRGGEVWANSDGRTTPVRTGLESELADPNAEIFVGTIDDAPVGYAAVHVRALHDGSAMARITDLFVIPAARRVGVGESLILSVEAWARRRALVGLDSLALPGDRDTKNFFETFGLVARALEVHRRLDG